MTPARRRLAVLFLLWVLPLGLALAAAAWVSRAGTIAVDVVEHVPGGDRVHLVLPAVLVDLALPFIPETVCGGASADMVRWGPVARVFCRELSRCPDGVLVEVKGPRETALIEKRGRALVVDVRSDEETVHVTLPIGTLTAVLSRLEKARSCRRVIDTSSFPGTGCLVRI